MNLPTLSAQFMALLKKAGRYLELLADFIEWCGVRIVAWIGVGLVIALIIGLAVGLAMLIAGVTGIPWWVVLIVLLILANK